MTNAGRRPGAAAPATARVRKVGEMRLLQPEKAMQFTRWVKTLGIQPNHASSPQAKGCVERADPTLQDRLVNALGPEGMDVMEADGPPACGRGHEHPESKRTRNQSKPRAFKRDGAGRALG